MADLFDAASDRYAQNWYMRSLCCPPEALDLGTIQILFERIGQKLSNTLLIRVTTDNFDKCHTTIYRKSRVLIHFENKGPELIESHHPAKPISGFNGKVFDFTRLGSNLASPIDFSLDFRELIVRKATKVEFSLNGFCHANCGCDEGNDYPAQTEQFFSFYSRVNLELVEGNWHILEAEHNGEKSANPYSIQTRISNCGDEPVVPLLPQPRTIAEIKEQVSALKSALTEQTEEQTARVIGLEKDAGAFVTYKDTQTGETLTRDLFLKMIHEGLYPDYHIRLINNQEVPVSNPNYTRLDNIGD